MKTIKGYKDYEGIRKDSIISMGFKVSNDNKPVAILECEDEFYLFPLSNGFEIHFCNDFMKSLKLIPDDHIGFYNYGTYKNTVNHIGKLLQINNVLHDECCIASSTDIYSIMLDGFRGKNLIQKAHTENDFHKYVLMALRKYNDLGGKMKTIYV